MLPRLAEHYRAIAVDLPGFGQSDPLSGPVTMEAIAQSMGQLLDALDVDRAHVFGYHTGNKVAAALAAEDASRVDRLILCGQIHSIIPEKAKRDEAIRQIVQKYFERFPDSADGDGLLRRWQADWSDLTGFAQPRQLFSQRSIRFEDIEALRIRVTDHLQALDHIADTYQANFAFDFEAALRRIAVPTLVVELVMPDEEHYGRQLTKVCALLGNGQGSTIMNAGKVALESHAAELTDQILRFCGTSP